MTARKPHAVTTNEKPMTVRFNTRTISSFLLTQVVFCGSIIWTGSAWAANMRRDIDEVNRENARQNLTLEKLTAALEKVADNSEQTARTLERVMGRLEMEEKR